jgi:RND family efflux transporter MFP subunit
MMKIRTYMLLVAGAALAAGALVGCSNEADAKAGAAQGRSAQAAVPVTLGRSIVRPLQRTVEVVGTLYGDEETTISAKVPGRVSAVMKDVGDRCGEGQPLAQIAPVDYELARTQTEMAMQETLAKLGLTEFPEGEFDPTNVPTVERARLQLANAEAKFRRGEQLYKQTPPLISEQDFADLQTAQQVARSDYDVTMLTARSLLAEARTRRSELDQASQRLADTTIRAPGTAPTTQPAAGGGRFAVSARLVSPGEYVSAGDAMFRLVADDPIKLRASVPERFVSRLRIGQKARITVDSYAKEFTGTIARINPQIDPASRTFQIEVVVPNKDGLLRPGSFARASVLTHVDEQVTFAPAGAVVSFAGVTKLFTVEDGKAVEARVRTGVTDGEWIEIVDGFEGANDVVVSGAARLANGTPVELRSAATTARTTQPAAPAAG